MQDRSSLRDPAAPRLIDEPAWLIAESLPQLVWSTLPDGRADYLNSRWCQFTGARKEDHLGWGWLEALHPDDRDPINELWAAAVREQREFEAEYRLKGANGVYRWFLSRGVAIRDSEGAVLRWFGTSTDIDEQKRSQQSERFLSELSDRLRPVNDPEEAMWIAVSSVGEHLGVMRATYAEIDLVNEQVIVSRDYHRDAKSAAGIYPISFFSTETMTEAKSGRTVVCCDAEKDTRTAGKFSDSYGPLGIWSFVAVPVVKEGALQYILTVQDCQPRTWMAFEVELLSDVAERTAQAVLRAHLFRSAAETETALRARQVELAFITENAPAHISRVDKNYRFLYVNSSYARRFGLSPDEVIGLQVRDVIGQSAFEVLKPYMDRAFAGERVSFSLEIPYATIGRRHMDVSYAPYDDTEGGSSGLIGIIQDVTEARRAEAALSASEATFRAIIQQIPEPVFVANLEGTYVNANEAACEMLGRQREEIVGKRVADYMRAEEAARLEESWLEGLAGVQRVAEWDMLHRDGHSVRCELIARFLPDGRWIAFARDITARDRHRREIEALNRRLQRAMTETHHRVKNNLQVVSALIDLQAMQHSESLPVRELKKLGQHIATLAAVHDVLTEQAKRDGDASLVSARSVLERLVLLLTHTVGQTLVVSRLDDAPLTARQGTGLALIAMELVSNAYKHGGRRVSLDFVADDGVARFSVKDNGPGFPIGFGENLAASTGLDLVDNLSRWDLAGKVAFENSNEGGGQVVIVFPISPLT